ncbi:hypothetical protein Sp245p_26190 (plasmid) [Azospirillum baldaniorum]|uniref:Uncharacterized protein n=1 Tax=Azospirillum baldaniorum TaxID=1064539 RepID=A0A9P1NRB5_9PROT|nr:hypothetical protein [Azospirillum baldaniorum]AWJ93314.1 hypothetical protein Sp245p_26190 [Azospirillum baldaniorum]TWA78016.1 hypothetical protein FBZ85_106176 [Azospirillum brasilense]CCD02882.1 protein of unknown function [Azospirillum baldaniorum]
MPPREHSPNTPRATDDVLTASAASEATAPATSGETVTVACKLPHGLELRTFTMEEVSEPVMGGGFRSVKMARQDETTFVIKGNAFPQNMAPEHPIIGGFGLTPGVPKGFWDKWLEQNASSALVRSGLIFAHAKPGHAEGEARERTELRSGLERIDPKNPPRVGMQVTQADV